jgi:hypothetical protein
MKTKYVISMIAQTSWDEQPRLYCLGFTGFDIMIPILCDYDDNDVWTFSDIETAKEVWNKYKDRLFERYGECIQKKNIFISEIKMTIDKVENLGE